MVRIAERYVGDQFRHLDVTQNRALGERIQMPPGPDSQIFPMVSTFMPSVMPGRGSLLRSINNRLLVSMPSAWTS